ncbi:MAG TPA: hypothetical protein PLF51_13650, partial [Candidatus Hydrogenedentes bacterium]|nr:hypothetical protein [Candidatus Hydrogenedentota bacterium]
VWGGTVVLINADMAARRSAALPAGPDWTANELLTLAAQLAHRTGRSQSIQVYGIAAAGEGLQDAAGGLRGLGGRPRPQELRRA